MERWTGTPEGTCNVLRMFRETHAISAIASSTTLNSSLTARVQLHQDVRHLIQKQKIKPTQKGEKQNEH